MNNTHSIFFLNIAFVTEIPTKLPGGYGYFRHEGVNKA